MVTVCVCVTCGALVYIGSQYSTLTIPIYLIVLSNLLSVVKFDHLYVMEWKFRPQLIENILLPPVLESQATVLSTILLGALGAVPPPLRRLHNPHTLKVKPFQEATWRVTTYHLAHLQD